MFPIPSSLFHWCGTWGDPMSAVPAETISSGSPNVRNSVNIFWALRVPAHALIRAQYLDSLCTGSIHSIRNRDFSSRPNTSNRNRAYNWSIAYDCNHHFSRCRCDTLDNLSCERLCNWPFHCHRHIWLTTFWSHGNRWAHGSPCRTKNKMTICTNRKSPSLDCSLCYGWWLKWRRIKDKLMGLITSKLRFSYLKGICSGCTHYRIQDPDKNEVPGATSHSPGTRNADICSVVVADSVIIVKLILRARGHCTWSPCIRYQSIFPDWFVFRNALTSSLCRRNVHMELYEIYHPSGKQCKLNTFEIAYIVADNLKWFVLATTGLNYCLMRLR